MEHEYTIIKKYATFPNSIKSRKVKVKDDIGRMVGVRMGGIYAREIKSRPFFFIFQIKMEPPN